MRWWYCFIYQRWIALTYSALFRLIVNSHSWGSLPRYLDWHIWTYHQGQCRECPRAALLRNSCNNDDRHNCNNIHLADSSWDFLEHNRCPIKFLSCTVSSPPIPCCDIFNFLLAKTIVSQGVVSQQLIKAAKSRDMAGCQEALQQGADVFATDQAKSCVPKQTVQTSPRSLFSFANATNRCKWWASFHFYPLLFSLGKYVRACTLPAKTSSVTSVLPCFLMSGPTLASLDTPLCTGRPIMVYWISASCYERRVLMLSCRGWKD